MRLSNLLTKLMLACVVLACVLAMSPNVADADLWGHVQYGRDVMREGLHRTTTYSFTADGYRWINHENLAELTLAALADGYGPFGLLWAKALAAGVVILLVMRQSLRAGAGVVATSAIALLTATNLAYHWSMRPQLLTFLCYTCMLAILSKAFAGWEGGWRLGQWVPHPASEDSASVMRHLSNRQLRGLAWLVPLFLIWTNSHGGFAAGLCLLLAYLGCRGVEVFATYGREAWRTIMILGATGAAVVTATFVNPYGFELHRWLLRSLGQARPEITEWHPPDLFDPLAIPLWLLMCTLVMTLAFTRRSRDFTHIVVLALTLWQALEHQRHIPFLALAFAFWSPRHLQSILDRCSEQGEASPTKAAGHSEPSPAWQRVLIAGFCLALGLLGYRLYDRLSDLPVHKKEFPVSAMQFMVNRRLNGNLVVTYNWAQYAIAVFNRDDVRTDQAKMRVAFDGRFRTCYPQDVVNMHFDFILGDLGEGLRSRGENSPPFSGDRVLAHGSEDFGLPNLVLINRFQPHAELVMRRNREQWCLLYQDLSAQVWGRRNWYDDPESKHYIPPAERVLGDEPQIGSVTWPAAPQASTSHESQWVKYLAAGANP